MWWPLAAFIAAATAAHLANVAACIYRCRRPKQLLLPPNDPPNVSIVRPVCGLENFITETLHSSFVLDYPRFELIFCAETARDPAVPVLDRLTAAHPHVPARLFIGRDAISDNPKLNNLCKGWKAASHDWIILADSNVLMPRDYIQRLLAGWRAGTGLVCSPPVGSQAEGFFAEVEIAFLNTYQARWQYAADTIGFGFAHGKNMLWHRGLAESWGGIAKLASELAEDAAATKLVRRARLKVRLVDGPFQQPLGYRSAAEVWRRQVRWARLRRASFASYFALEILAGAAPPLLATAALVGAGIWPIGSMIALAVLWYGSEAALAYAAGWHLSARFVLASIFRDALNPAVWVAGWIGREFLWRGNTTCTAETGGAT